MHERKLMKLAKIRDFRRQKDLCGGQTIDPGDGAGVQVFTHSHFHDPMKIVARRIRESLDPDKAPKTISVYIAPPKQGPEPRPGPGPGPETTQKLAIINAKHAMLVAIRIAHKRILKLKTPLSHGITSEFVVEKLIVRSAAENTVLAVEFLSGWVSGKGGSINAIRRDARINHVPWAAVLRAKRQLGVVSGSNGTWSLCGSPDSATIILAIEFVLKQAFPEYLRIGKLQARVGKITQATAYIIRRVLLQMVCEGRVLFAHQSYGLKGISD